MKRQVRRTLILAGLALALPALAGIPTEITYQGRLLDTEGRPLSTTVMVRVGLYTNESGGVAVHTETVGPVLVQNGIYSFRFGTNAAAMRAVLLAPECWLELVLDEQPLTPRQKLAAVPYAIRSGEPDHVGSNTVFSPGVIAGAALTDGAVDSNKLAASAVSAVHLGPDVLALFATGTPVYAESDPVWNAEKAGYATGTPLYAESDPVWQAEKTAYATGMPVYAETDPVYQSEKSLLATGTPVYVEADPVYEAEKSLFATGMPLYVEADPVWVTASNLYYLRTQADALFATGVPVYVETDPVWQAEKAAYATGTPLYAETDPVWQAQKAGYATGTPLYVEADPLWAAASNLYYLRSEADSRFATGTPVYAESDPVWNAEKAGYATGTPLYAESDPVWQAEKTAYATGMPVYAETDPVYQSEKSLLATGTPVYVEADPVYEAEKSLFATGMPLYVEADPVWATASNLYYLRSQADALFATGVPVYVEADPVWQAQKAGYATGTPLYVEADPLWAAASNAYLTTNLAAATYVKKSGDAMTGALALPAGGLSVGGTQLVVLANGNIGLGISNPTNRLAVNGSIRAKEVLVSLDGWPDYVFASAYPLLPLAEVEAHIRRAGRLPGMPSAQEVAENGLPLGDMQARVVRAVEELTLHVIALAKENAELKRRLARLEAGQR